MNYQVYQGIWKIKLYASKFLIKIQLLEYGVGIPSQFFSDISTAVYLLQAVCYSFFINQRQTRCDMPLQRLQN